jgi:hypothetical protein
MVEDEPTSAMRSIDLTVIEYGLSTNQRSNRPTRQGGTVPRRPFRLGPLFLILDRLFKRWIDQDQVGVVTDGDPPFANNTPYA